MGHHWCLGRLRRCTPCMHVSYFSSLSNSLHFSSLHITSFVRSFLHGQRTSQREFWSLLGDKEKEGQRRKEKIWKEVNESVGGKTKLTEKGRIEKRRRKMILEVRNYGWGGKSAEGMRATTSKFKYMTFFLQSLFDYLSPNKF